MERPADVSGTDARGTDATADPVPDDDGSGGARPSLVACPSCGAANAASRGRCARCRADLRTGEDDPRAVPDVGADDADEVREPPLPGLLVMGAVIVSIAVMAVALTLLSARGVGPFAGPAPPDPLASEPSRIEVVDVSASSELPAEGSTTYAASNLVDGDPATAWNEGEPGDGVTETIQLELEGPSRVTGLLVWNGYQDGDAFVEHPRVSELRLSLGERTFAVTLLDRRGPQAIDLPEPIAAEGITLEVVSVVPGDRYNDTSLSEIAVRGVPDA